MRSITAVLLAMLIAGLALDADAQAVATIADVYTPVSPSPIAIGHQQHLVWEIWVINQDQKPLRITAVEVDDQDASRLITLDEAALPAQFAVIRGESAEETEIPPHQTGVIYLWHTLTGEPPTRLEQRVTLVTEAGDEHVRHLRTPVLAEPPRVLRPPLLGEGWVAANVPSNASRHRRSVQVLEEGLFTAQRYAVDFVRVVGESTFEGDPVDNTSYHAYGAEALAMADGTIVALHDGIPENVPGADSRVVEITYETLAGNYVVIDLGGDRFAVYAHLQPGSLRVQVGDPVLAGQLLGLVGNSGNSTEPHLHLHVCDAPDVLACHGRPFVFTEFVQVPIRQGDGGQFSSGQPEYVRDELPIEMGYLIFRAAGRTHRPAALTSEKRPPRLDWSSWDSETSRSSS